MQTKTILFSVIICGLLACSNQASDQPGVQTNIEKASNPDSTTFTIVTEQDSTQNGESIIKYKSGKVKMQGMMKDGKREGLWKSFYENGNQWSESVFTAGIKNGKTSTWYENGNKRYDGFYTNDMESGKWTYWDEAGKLFTTRDNGK